MQLHAPTCARMLKIPQTGIIWTHKNTDILIGMGSAALVAAVALPGKADTIFPQWMNGVLKKLIAAY